MKKIKSFIKCLLLPTGVTIAFCIPFSAAGVFHLIISETSLFEKIFVALLCIYTLTVIGIRIPSVIEFLKSVQKNNVFVNRFTTDPFMRAKFSIPASIVFDIIYISIQCIIGLVTMSFWYYLLAGYYVALAVMRLFLLREFKPGKTLKSGLQVRLFIGISLLFLNIALGGIVFYIVNFDRGFTFSIGWIGSLATLSYTIGALITATVGVTKYRKLRNSALTASKVINFTSAAVSILVLETVLIDTYGSAESLEFRRTITSVTGALVCIFVLSLAVYLIFAPIKAKIKHKKRLRAAKKAEKAKTQEGSKLNI